MSIPTARSTPSDQIGTGPSRPEHRDPDRSIHLVCRPIAELIQIVVPDEVARDVQLCFYAVGTAIALLTPVLPLVWKRRVSNPGCLQP